MDGYSIQLDRDNWGFEGLNGDALQLPNDTFLEVYVSDLKLQNHDGWNIGRVHDLFGDYLACCICDVLIFPHGPNDKMTKKPSKTSAPCCGTYGIVGTMPSSKARTMKRV
ncbi:hypothetical protein J1N35_037598 [Gossypium stocksii]|uniref:Uncharacterized protein n=1 Tax=Gossypium stocksii TaxID=47602 RepID=A0A9D3UMB8_9ROSI|nr:hypothetical protein J1N35_037598 [Gossypium stocksii]